jgi:hypothetical protein
MVLLAPYPWQPTLTPSDVAGDGGAIFLGVGSLDCIIDNTTLKNNSAMGRGGAISSIALVSTIELHNVVARSNVAGGQPATAQLRRLAAGREPTGQNEGGAVLIGGGSATLLLLNSTLEENEAAQVAQVGCTSATWSFMALCAGLRTDRPGLCLW